MLSKDPWDTPIVKINNKHINGEILKLFNLKIVIEKMFENKKKIKEWVRFIFFISLFIFKIIVLKKQIWAF